MDFYREFVSRIPKFLNSTGIRAEADRWFDGNLEGLASSAKYEELYDAVRSAFSELADQHVTLGWDGNAPGMSGAVYLTGYNGCYIVTCSDRGGDRTP